MRAPLSLIAIALANPAAAGPWTKDRGELYVKLSQSVFASDSYRDATGAVVSGVDYLGFTHAIYAEVGLLDGWHAQLYLPHVAAVNTLAAGDRFLSAGGGDLVLGVQARVPLPLPAAIRVTLKSPLYDVGAIEGVLAQNFPQRGDGQIDATAWASLGGGLPGLPLYAFAEVGHRLRTERYVGEGSDLVFADTFVWAAQLGWSVAGGLILAANGSGAQPYVGDEVTKAYVGLGPSLFWPVGGGLALEASFDQIVYAENSAEGFSAGLGVSYGQ